jgi:hypothetical protein
MTLIFIVVYAAIRYIVEYELGYKNVPFLASALAISFLIEAIRTKDMQVICLVVGVYLFIVAFYVENEWLSWGFRALFIASIFAGTRCSKISEAHQE